VPLYGLEGQAHGEALAQGQLVFAMNESHGLLRDLWLLTIEKGHVLGTKDFEDALVG